MINLKQLAGSDQIRYLKEAYLQTLVGPMDAYWETAVIGLAPHWLIEVDGDPAGYFAAQNNKRLLQFYVTDPFLGQASSLFAFVVNSGLVSKASAATIEPAYLSHCLDHQIKVSTNSLLFEDYDQQIAVELDNYPTALFRRAMDGDAGSLAAFYSQNDEFQDTEAIETGFGSHLNHARSMIELGQVFILEMGKEILGVGECRFSASQPPYADVGMITAGGHRRRGIGVFILAKLKDYCYQNQKQPVCSCAAGNLPSRKTIEKAGFITQHRILDIQFSTKT